MCNLCKEIIELGGGQLAATGTVNAQQADEQISALVGRLRRYLEAEIAADTGCLQALQELMRFRQAQAADVEDARVVEKLLDELKDAD